MSNTKYRVEVFDERMTVTLTEVCEICSVREEQVLELVDHGIADPEDPRRRTFSGGAVARLGRALRLQRDLGVNAAGAALALDLMEEIESLRRRLRR